MSEELKLWKRQARSYQQSCCNSLCDRVYDRVNEELLALKVGYALYNTPSEIDQENKTAVYTKAQQKHIKLVCDKVKALQPSQENLYYISYVYIVIKLRTKKREEGVQVLFRIPKFEDGKPNLTCHVFVDPKPRKYETWGDYLKKNKLPKCEMCFPVNGVYNVIDGSVDLTFGASQACDKSTAVFNGLDVSSTVLMVGATGVTLVSLAVPIAAPVVWGATATFFASGTYETARTFYRLHDINKHGESLGLKNPDSRSAWLSLAGSIVGMASIGTTAIAKGVVATESAISRTGLMTLRILNTSSLALSGIGIVNGIATLVMKFVNGKLEVADILSFTSACLFFLNAIVSYQTAGRLIEELANSDLTRLFNLRVNSTYRVTKEILDFRDSTTYKMLRQLVQGVRSHFFPNFEIEDLESTVFGVVSLLAKKGSGTIGWIKFANEMVSIFQKIWRRYENIILKAIDEIKHTFEIPYWQMGVPKLVSTNLEIPRQMCEEVDRVVEYCGIMSHSKEHQNLLTFARAFSASCKNPSHQEFTNRFKFYCDCIVAQFREGKENYENELDSQCAEPNFDRRAFDISYGIQGNKNEFFFIQALHKVNHPDFLGNIDELYENLPRTDEGTNAPVPFLKTRKSTFYTFCGPVNENHLPDSYYWEKTVDLTGLPVNGNDCHLERNNDLVMIQPKIQPKLRLYVGVQGVSSVDGIEAILIHSSFINHCHMGLIQVILK